MEKLPLPPLPDLPNLPDESYIESSLSTDSSADADSDLELSSFSSLSWSPSKSPGSLSWLQKLGLSDDVQEATRATRLNGQTLGPETIGKIVGHGNWEMGCNLKWYNNDNSFFIQTWAVQYEVHTVTLYGNVTRDGLVRNGRVNDFDLGWMSLDQEYFDNMMEELKECPLKWDLISCITAADTTDE